MAISNFIPEVWSAAILETLRSKLVFGSLCNRDYEGDIAEAGDTVHITGITDITVKTYDRTAEIDIEAASDKDAGTLNIDQSDYFAFYVGDLNAVQAKGNLTGTFTNSAAYGMAKKVDTYIAGLMDKAISKETAKINVKTPADAYTAVVAAGQALDEADVPDEGRWIAVSPAFYAMLLKDPLFVSGTESGHSTLLNGVVGSVNGMTVVKSNNVPADTAKKTQSIIAGNNMATTFAQQISKVEAMRMEKRFADMVRGLDLYAGKVVRPECLAKVTLTIDPNAA